MVHCACCKKENHIIEENAYKCKGVGCGKYYHYSCGNRLINEYGCSVDGVFFKCCGSDDDIFRHKQNKKLKLNQVKEVKIKNNRQNSQQSQHSDTVKDTVVLDPSQIQSLITQRNFESDEMQENLDKNTKMGTVTNDQLQSQLSSLLSKIDVLIKSNNETLLGNITRLDEKIDSIIKKFENQQTQIDEVCTRLDMVEKSMEESKDETMEETIFEINERKRRERNLIFFNVPDSNDGTSDKNIILSLFPSNIDPAIVVRTIRLRKKGIDQHSTDSPSQNFRGTIPPLKVIFRSDENIQWLFQNMKNISWNGITFTKDNTPSQRARYHTAKTEIATRLRNGESNLKIKYISGIPRVVKINTGGSNIKPNSRSKNLSGGRNQA